MILREIYYNILMGFRQKDLFFWVMVFPSVLCAFFTLAFSGIGAESFEAIKVAVTPDNEYPFIYEYIPILEVVKTDDPEKALEEGKISGIFAGDHTVIVKESGSEASVLKYIEDQAVRSAALGPAAEKIAGGNVMEYEFAGSDPVCIPFYSLVGMTGVFGYFAGFNMAVKNQGNLSREGRRRMVSPLPKSRLIFGGFLAALLMNLLSLGILFFVMTKVFRSDYFPCLSESFFLGFTGSVFGTAAGILIGSLRGSYDKKLYTGIVLSLLLSFLSGMMATPPLFFIEEHFPVLYRWNPVNIVTQNLLLINEFGDFTDYRRGIFRILILSLWILIGAYFSLRRNSYDDI